MSKLRQKSAHNTFYYGCNKLTTQGGAQCERGGERGPACPGNERALVLASANQERPASLCAMWRKNFWAGRFHETSNGKPGSDPPPDLNKQWLGVFRKVIHWVVFRVRGTFFLIWKVLLMAQVKAGQFCRRLLWSAFNFSHYMEIKKISFEPMRMRAV